MSSYPERIVCLTEEPTEVLYALGADHRIVGISQFTVRPARALAEKPKVSAFTSARIERILALEPDLAIGFSDIQADIARDLIAAGVEVWVSNHRSVDGILAYIRRLGAMVGAHVAADAYAADLEARIADVRRAAGGFARRPRVYFEEWNDPLISGIAWVSELMGIAGGDDVFPELAASSLAKGRIIADPDDVVRRAPEIMLASWCGKRFQRSHVDARPGWDTIPAVANDDVHEIPSPIILQPGPAALTEGLDMLHGLFRAWSTDSPQSN